MRREYKKIQIKKCKSEQHPFSYIFYLHYFQYMGPSEHGNESWGSIKGGEFLH